MDLSTTYLGLTLRTPIVPSASPLSEELDDIKRMEDAGAAAVVLYSLFEEELPAAQAGPGREGRVTAYLEHIRRAKEAVDIPIIASLNGTSIGGWPGVARQIAAAGAAALELNVYYLPTEPDLSAAAIEQAYLDTFRAVKAVAPIPVAMKLSPYFTSLMHMANELDAAGVDGLVLFNRFYQPDIDLERREVTPSVLLSTPEALRLPLTWIGILHGRIAADLAATSGIHTAADALKMLMAGARVTMLCSALLQHGIPHIRVVEQGLREWLERHGHTSVREIQGILSQQQCTDPAAFERTQYMNALQRYLPREVAR